VRYTTNMQEIQKFLVDRTAMEQELALALSKEFQSGDLFRRINIAVWASFIFLKNLKKEPQLEAKINGLEQANGFLFHTDPKTVEGVLAYMDKGMRLSPEQCGNLIRFYGEVVEACGAMSIYWYKERMKQIAWRYGGGGEAFKAKQNMGRFKAGDSTFVAQADKGMVWQKLENPKQVAWLPRMVSDTTTEWHKSEGVGLSGGRIRASEFKKVGGQKVKDDRWKSELFKNGANPYYDIIPGNLCQSPELKDVHVGKKFGGVMVWQIQDTSTIGKIDRTFGLPFGADISGTTTDNLYFLTGWADVSKGDPIVMMLPLAAIVGEYHHSLIEVAGAMTLRKVISYSIGFYSTLLPKLPEGVSPSSQRASIEGLLQQFEKDGRNQHILLHYNEKNRSIAGCFIVEPADMAAFQKLATLDIRLWPKFNNMPPYPTEDKIMQLFAEVGLANAALASKRGALRSVGGVEAMNREQARLGRHGL